MKTFVSLPLLRMKHLKQFPMKSVIQMYDPLYNSVNCILWIILKLLIFQDIKLSREFEEHPNKNKITEEINREEQSEISDEGKKIVQLFVIIYSFLFNNIYI